MAREIGIGLLGVGWMGELHTASYKRVADHYPDCEARPRFVIAADEVESRARRAVERLGYEGWTSDWREVLQHPDVEAVSITTPNSLHREMAVAAARAGKHFWGEKPLGRVPQDTAEIAAAAEAAGVLTIVGLNYRHPPAVQHVRNLIASGQLGEIRHYRGHFLNSYAQDPRGALSWRFSRQHAGLGVLGDLMTHVVDLAQFLLGPIARVAAQTATLITQRPKVPPGSGTHFALVEGGELAEVENEDWAASLVEFESGVRGYVEVSRVAVGPECRMDLELNGSIGAARWNFERMNELELRLPLASGDAGYATIYMGPQHPEFARFQPGPALGMSFGDLKVIEAHLFLQSLVDDRQREPGVREMLATAQVIDGMLRSTASGAWERVERTSA